MSNPVTHPQDWWYDATRDVYCHHVENRTLSGHVVEMMKRDAQLTREPPRPEYKFAVDWSLSERLLQELSNAVYSTSRRSPFFDEPFTLKTPKPTTMSVSSLTTKQLNARLAIHRQVAEDGTKTAQERLNAVAAVEELERLRDKPFIDAAKRERLVKLTKEACAIATEAFENVPTNDGIFRSAARGSVVNVILQELLK